VIYSSDFTYGIYLSIQGWRNQPSVSSSCWSRWLHYALLNSLHNLKN